MFKVRLLEVPPGGVGRSAYEQEPQRAPPSAWLSGMRGVLVRRLEAFRLEPAFRDAALAAATRPGVSVPFEGSTVRA